MPVREKTEPTERSMPPVMTTSRTPNAMMTSGADACATLDTLPTDSAAGTMKPTASSITMMAIAIAISVR